MVCTHCATLAMTGIQARARPISRTQRKKKLELDARKGRVAGRQLLINDSCEQGGRFLQLQIFEKTHKRFTESKITFLM